MFERALVHEPRRFAPKLRGLAVETTTRSDLIARERQQSPGLGANQSEKIEPPSMLPKVLIQ
jgi:hypothetical protein